MRARRLVALLPTIAFVATFGVFFVDKRGAASSVLRSGRGLLLVAVIVAGYVGVAVVLRRVARAGLVAPVVLTGVVLGLAAWIVRPYYVDTVAPVAAPETGTTTTSLGAPAPSDGPKALGAGMFRGLDGHDGEGTASLVDLGDGSLVVRLTDFDIEGVPDPRVHLLEGEDEQEAGGLDLGRLQANKGAALDIPVPAGAGAGAGWTVLVWCRAFGVPVANATLTLA